MYEKDIPGWSVVKKNTHISSRNTFCKQREVWWVKIGHNVGVEVDGKGTAYSRPVVVIRSFGLRSFLAIPLTSQNNSNSDYKIPVTIPGVTISNYALINQLRVLDTKRLIRKIGMISKSDASIIKEAITGLVELID